MEPFNVSELRYKKVASQDKEYFFDDMSVFCIGDVIDFGGVFQFDYNDCILTINDDIFELNTKFKFKTKTERSSFCEVLGIVDPQKHNKEYINKKSKKWEINFRKCVLKIIQDQNESVENVIYDLVENQQVSAGNNDLVQGVRSLLLEVGLCHTHSRFLVPLENNITAPVDMNDILHIIYKLTNIRNISEETFEKAIKYFKKEVSVDYHLIKTNNGYYDFETGEFHEAADHTLIINKKSPYNYNPHLIRSTPPKILNDFFCSTFEGEEWKVRGLLQIFGYMLDDGNQFQIMPILIGKSRAGKGVCFKLLSGLISNNISSVDIFNVDFQSKYAQSLIDADINIIEEFKGCKNIAEVKNYLGEGGLDIARIYESTRLYSDLELPKTILSTNNLGGIIEDLDYALMARLSCVLEFNHTIPLEKRDSKLHLKLLNDPDVMDWLLTNSLYEFSLIRDTGGFLCLKPTNEMNDILDKYQNPKEHLLRQHFKFDMEAYQTELELENYDSLVTISDIRECIYNEFEILTKQVKGCVCRAFSLSENKYDDFKNEYTIDRLYNSETKQYCDVIEGLVKLCSQ